MCRLNQEFTICCPSNLCFLQKGEGRCFKLFEYLLENTCIFMFFHHGNYEWRPLQLIGLLIFQLFPANIDTWFCQGKTKFLKVFRKDNGNNKQLLELLISEHIFNHFLNSLTICLVAWYNDFNVRLTPSLYSETWALFTRGNLKILSVVFRFQYQSHQILNYDPVYVLLKIELTYQTKKFLCMNHLCNSFWSMLRTSEN